MQQTNPVCTLVQVPLLESAEVYPPLCLRGDELLQRNCISISSRAPPTSSSISQTQIAPAIIASPRLFILLKPRPRFKLAKHHDIAFDGYSSPESGLGECGG
jgi:hypothetical protein